MAHRRRRHGLQDSYTCIICNQAVETMDHIILGCVFSKEVWSACLRSFRLHDLVLIQEGDIMVWWTDSRRRLPKPIRQVSIPCSSSLDGRCGRKEMQEPSMGRQGQYHSCSRLSRTRTPRGLRRATDTWGPWTRFGVRFESVPLLSRE
jgi:hypothetical protein